MSVEEDLKTIMKRLDALESKIEGNGRTILHNARFDVDKTVRVSDILGRISALENRVTVLEA